MIEVIGARASRTFRVLWMLEELGESYRHVSVKPHAPEVTRRSAAGKIPVVIVNGEALTDSTAILQHFADRQGVFTCQAGTVERARQDGWTCLLLDEFDACLWAAAKHSFVLPEAVRVKAVKPALKWEFRKAVGRLAGRLGDGPFLMGESMTVPDFILTHCLVWANVAGFAHSEPGVDAYFDRLRSRPAFQKVSQL